MTGSARRREIDRFLARAGWNGAAVEPLAADASFRRYLRVRRGPETAVLMDAPPDREPIEPYAAIARHLLSLGFAAPRIEAEDPSRRAASDGGSGRRHLHAAARPRRGRDGALRACRRHADRAPPPSRRDRRPAGPARLFRRSADGGGGSFPRLVPSRHRPCRLPPRTGPPTARAGGMRSTGRATCRKRWCCAISTSTI